VVLEVLQLQLEQRQWAGPLPPPAILYQYEQVRAGLVERIVAMAETAATGETRRDWLDHRITDRFFSRDELERNCQSLFPG
jgi:uncharacterized membrane protein